MGRNEVATWKRCRDIGEAPEGRDLEKMKSRPGLGAGQEKRCRDSVWRSRPGVA